MIQTMDDPLWRNELVRLMYADVLASNEAFATLTPGDEGDSSTVGIETQFANNHTSASVNGSGALDCTGAPGSEYRLLHQLASSATSPPNMTDLTLRLCDGDIRVHKLIFVMVSPYFRCMLNTPYKENQSGVVCLPTVDTATMALLVQYVYTGAAAIKQDNVLDLLLLADYFQIAALAKICCHVAKRSLCPSSCLLLYSVATACQYRDLARHALLYACRHSSQLLADLHNLRAAPPEALAAVLRHSHLRKDGHTTQLVLAAVKAWSEEDTSRLQHVTQLLNIPELCILLHQHPQLAEVLTLHPDHRHLEHLPPVGSQLLSGSECDAFDLMRAQEHIEMAPVVFAIGGERCGQLIKSTECYDGQKWSFMFSVPNIELSLSQRNLETEQLMLHRCRPRVQQVEGLERAVPGDAMLHDAAMLPGDAMLHDAAMLPGDAMLHDAAMVPGDAMLHDAAMVPGDAMLHDAAMLPGDAMLHDAAMLPADDIEQRNHDGQALRSESYHVKDPKLNKLLNDAYHKRCRIVQEMMDTKESAFRIPTKNITNIILKESEPRLYGAVACLEESSTVVVMGGRCRTGLLASVSSYSVASNTWTELPPLPVGVQGGGAAAIEGTLYHAAGAAAVDYSNSLWRLCPGSQQWEQLSSLPCSGLCHVAVAALNGTLYLTGGVGKAKGAALRDCWKYEPLTDQWSQIAPLHACRSYHGAAVVAGQLYALGGFDGHYWLPDVERYDVLADAWTPVCRMLSPRSSFGVCVRQDRIYALGGFNGYRATNSVESYSAKTDSWHTAPSLRVERLGGVAACLDMRRWSTECAADDCIDIT